MNRESCTFPIWRADAFSWRRSIITPGNLEEFAYRLYSDLESEGLHMEVTDLGTNHTVSRHTLLHRSLNDPAWTEDNQIWAAYQVWQEPDGTVYLEDGGNSYGGTLIAA